MLLREQRSEIVSSILKEQWEKNYLANKRWILARDDPMRDATEGRYPPQGPCLVVGAGPSVNKNLADIDRSLYTIIACDKITPKLIARDIVPDFICALNAAHTDVKEWLKPANMQGVDLIVPCGVNPEAYEDWNGGLLFINAVTSSGLHERVKAECGYRDVVIGSNAGTFAYTMAVYLGYNPIAYMGLDFSFLAREEVMRKYFKPEQIEIFGETIKFLRPEAGYNILEMTDINGDVRYLDLGWFDMAQAFQEKARDYAQFFGIRTINCTEGGINYSPYCGSMTLKTFNEKLKGGEIELPDNGRRDAWDSPGEGADSEKHGDG